MVPDAHRPVIALILAIAGLFMLQKTSEDELGSLMMTPVLVEEAASDIRAGQGDSEDWRHLSTMLTAPLLHDDMAHLASNLLFLWMFAGLASELLGWRWMLAIFGLTALGGSLGDLILRSGSAIPSLGASGSVLGFEGAYLGLAVRWTLPYPAIWPIAYPIPPFKLALVAGIGFFLDITGALGGVGQIAYGAHLGGFLVGLFLTALITPAPKTHQ